MISGTMTKRELHLLMLMTFLSLYGGIAQALPTYKSLELHVDKTQEIETKATFPILKTEKRLNIVKKSFRNTVGSPTTPGNDGSSDEGANYITNKQTDNVHVSGQRQWCSSFSNLLDGNTLPSARNRRFALQGEKWPKNKLTYYIQRYTSSLQPSQDLTRQIIRKSFHAWEKNSTLHFTEVFDDRADISLSFLSGDHGDGAAFEKNGAPGHAFNPDVGGDVHLNDDITWTIGTNTGYDLETLATHFIGHSLGLGHSSHKDAVMFAQYSGPRAENSQLAQDDIYGIQALYGIPVVNEEKEKEKEGETVKGKKGSPQILVIVGVAAGLGCLVLIAVAATVVAVKRRRRNAQVNELNELPIQPHPLDSVTSRNKATTHTNSYTYLEISDTQIQGNTKQIHQSRRHSNNPEDRTRNSQNSYHYITSSTADDSYEHLKSQQISRPAPYLELRIPVDSKQATPYDNIVTPGDSSADVRLGQTTAAGTFKDLHSPEDGYIQVLEE